MTEPAIPSGTNPSSIETHAYKFNADATPEQKKQQALNAAPPGLKTAKANASEELVSDVASAPTINMPAPSSSGSSVQKSHEEAKVGCKFETCP